MEDNTNTKLKVLYDSDNVTVDFLRNYKGKESIRISYFQDGHWVGESWVDDALSQENASFRKDF